MIDGRPEADVMREVRDRRSRYDVNDMAAYNRMIQRPEFKGFNVPMTESRRRDVETASRRSYGLSPLKYGTL
jgi:hypothetical protein